MRAPAPDGTVKPKTHAKHANTAYARITPIIVDVKTPTVEHICNEQRSVSVNNPVSDTEKLSIVSTKQTENNQKHQITTSSN